MTDRSFDGHGQQVGPLHPDWGDSWADLECDQCAATWLGPIDEACPWCARALELAIETQADLVLTPPDIDPRDHRHPNALLAWADRLWIAVEAGIITRPMAERALRREKHRAA